MKKEIILDGNNFSSLAEFYEEIQNKLTKDLDWEIGRNLDAYNDVLRGGFGVYEYEEAIKLLWKNSEKSKKDLGFPETIKYIEKKLKTCHPTNISFVKNDLEEAKKGSGKTLFEIIIDIIHEHKHIELKLE
jgi:RNAse (barnase) inhibitor barstar